MSDFIVVLDDEEKEETNPSNTVSNLIPDTSKEESSNEYSDKNDQVLTKKRRSFIPVESNLKEVVVSEAKHKRAEGNKEPETEKNEQSGDAPSVTSGDSEDSNNEKASEKTEQPEESGESGIDGYLILNSIFMSPFH